MDPIKADLETSGKEEAMEIAEGARETTWEHPSFVGELFMGRFRPEYLLPFPEQSKTDREIGDVFLAKLEKFLIENLDPDYVDRTGEIPTEVIQGLIELGAFAMKLPKEYGGLDLSQVNYSRVMMLVASYCTNTTVWLSAHQSIGVPQPLKLFGTKQQKEKYMPMLRNGALSAFALTEPDVGSDPARMSTTATPTPDGKFYRINGEKLWCTNGPVADVIVVMAQTPPKMIKGKERKQITAFIVETKSPGFEVVHRCSFMGLKGIQNGLLRFKDVEVPKENVLWEEGKGLKLALMTLNAGRLTLPAATTGGVKQCLRMVRDWANERVQWGVPIGKHEAIAAKLAWMNAHGFAMEATSLYASALADRKDRDIRLEAAMAKLFCSEVAWEIMDMTLQIRGGRGYETADSLRARGEKPYPIERLLRDGRINTIIEGSSEIMHLMIAREALDPHMKLGAALLDPRAGFGEKFSALFKMGMFYATWYPRQWWTLSTYFKHRGQGKLGKHLRFVENTSHRLARNILHAMGRYRAGLERRQMVMTRLVDIGVSLFTMAAACSRAIHLAKSGGKRSNAVQLADLYCRYQRKSVRANFKALFDKDDKVAYGLSREFLQGDFAWLEDTAIPWMDYPDRKIVPNGEQELPSEEIA